MQPRLTSNTAAFLLDSLRYLLGKLVKLVMLPGMDGTGRLFERLIQLFPPEIEPLVIPLPTTGSQSYEALTQSIRMLLPEQEPYFLLGESFSGRIAFEIATDNSPLLLGVIYVASFLSTPTLARMPLPLFTPLKQMLFFPGTSSIGKYFTVGSVPNNQVWLEIVNSIAQVKNNTITARLKALRQLKTPLKPNGKRSLSLIPAHDRLVDKNASSTLELYCTSLTQKTITGSHFILQMNPQECASQIIKFISNETAKEHNK